MGTSKIDFAFVVLAGVALVCPGVALGLVLAATLTVSKSVSATLSSSWASYSYGLSPGVSS